MAQKALDRRHEVPGDAADTGADTEGDASDAEVKALQAEVEALNIKLKGERSRADREIGKSRTSLPPNRRNDRS